MQKTHLSRSATMVNTRTRFISVAPCVKEWAKSWKQKEPEYLQNASLFGSPLVKRIANYILSITHETQENCLSVIDGKVRAVNIEGSEKVNNYK